MKVLIACEFSGVVRDTFAERGHDSWSCDILPTENKGNHIQDDVLKYLDKDWDLLIAHPPCTYLSKAGARWLYPKAGQLDPVRYEKGLENPTPLKIFKLPKPTQAIQPYEFGHNFSKRTLLWLKNLTQLKPTDIVNDYKPLLPSNTGGKKRGQKSNIGFVHTDTIKGDKDASRTFIGIAKAMAEQWG
jgi:hypothetical protein